MSYLSEELLSIVPYQEKHAKNLILWMIAQKGEIKRFEDRLIRVSSDGGGKVGGRRGKWPHFSGIMGWESLAAVPAQRDLLWVSAEPCTDIQPGCHCENQALVLTWANMWPSLRWNSNARHISVDYLLYFNAKLLIVHHMRLCLCCNPLLFLHVIHIQYKHTMCWCMLVCSDAQGIQIDGLTLSLQ